MKYCSAYLWEKGREEVCNPVSLVLQQVQVRKQAVLLGCVCRGAVGVEKKRTETYVAGVGEGGAGGLVAGIERDNAGSLAVEVSGYFTEALVEWFHRECLELLERKCAEAEVERSLKKEVEATMSELRQFAAKKQVEVCMDGVGILLVEQWFWIFSVGKGQVFLINRRYNRKNMRQIAGGIKAESVTKEEQGASAKISGVNEKSVGADKNSVNVHWESGVIQKRLGLLLCTEGFLEETQGEEVAEVLLTDGEIKEEKLQRRLRELWESRRNKEDSVGTVYIRTY